jgi:hypothetical protein
VNRELAVLRRGFTLAVRKGMLPTMPAFTLRSEAGNERQGFVDAADFEGLLGAPPTLRACSASYARARRSWRTLSRRRI